MHEQPFRMSHFGYIATKRSLEECPKLPSANRISHYYHRRYEHEEDAQDAAQELLSLWKGRSWILTDVGSTVSHRQLIFKFTHQTFLEYFAAVELVRLHPSPELLWEAMHEKVSVGAWDIVAQVAIQRLNESYEDASDEIVRRLNNDAQSAKNQAARLNLVAFACRNLDALYVQPETCRELTRLAVDLALLKLPGLPTMPDDRAQYAKEVAKQDEALTLPLVYLGEQSERLRRISSDEAANHQLAVFWTSRSLLTRARAFVFVVGSGSIPGLDRLLATDEVQSAQSRIITEVGSSGRTLRQNLEACRSQLFWVSVIAHALGIYSTIEVVERIDSGVLFRELGPFEEELNQSIAEWAVREYFGLPLSTGTYPNLRLAEVVDAIANLADPGDSAILRFNTGWLIHRTTVMEDLTNSHRTTDRDLKDLGSTYGAAVLLCAFIEIEDWRMPDFLDDEEFSNTLGPVGDLWPVFCARRRTGFEDTVIDVLQESNLSATQCRALALWAEGRLSFCN